MFKDEKIRILFLCTGNSCRSQMAEGFARIMKRDVIEPYSAGLDPVGLNPHAVTVMREADIDISSQVSKHLDDLADVDFDYVITLCGNADERCPSFASDTHVIHVGFPDPAEMAEKTESKSLLMDHFRAVRDQIRDFVDSLPRSLTS